MARSGAVRAAMGRRLKRARRAVAATPWRACGAALLVLAAVWYLTLPRGDEYLKVNPRSSALIEQRRAEALSRGEEFEARISWRPLREISPYLVRAVIVAEDWNFLSHGGVDFGAIGEALQQAWREKELPRGASTITQQLAKNLYFSTTRSPFRKLSELVLARRLERYLGKRRILELYLNVIEWGDGTFGAEAAARRYFHKPAGSLSEDESAFLAAMIPGPLGLFNPQRNLRRVEKRQRLIQQRMRKARIAVPVA